MTSRPKRLRRCQLSVPGSSEKMMAKAAASAADHVFLDLEDAVAYSAKREARGKIVEALNGLDWGRKTKCVRINDLETEYAYEDVIEVVEGAHAVLDTIMIPKVKRAADVIWVDTLLSQMEKKLKLTRRIGLELLIEEVEGMMNVEEIARATPRLEAMVFGMGDYSASQGIDIGSIGSTDGYPGDIWHYPRYRMIIACKSYGLDPVDGPFADFRDPEAYREECRRAAILGYVGKWAIHPAQIDIAQEVFSPTRAQVDQARAMIKAYEEAQAKGLGAVQYEGKMIDVASVRIIRNITDKADLIGM
jgi:citrate lyase subunit beta/citryl-CoA lyase